MTVCCDLGYISYLFESDCQVSRIFGVDHGLSATSYDVDLEWGFITQDRGAKAHGPTRDDDGLSVGSTISVGDREETVAKWACEYHRPFTGLRVLC